MCGIVGYIGHEEAAPILLDGLSRLSYRGYDSAGVAVIDNAEALHVRKAAGRLENLQALLTQQPLVGCLGIGHTRWATHGGPSRLNAHPHTDIRGGIAVVHNGIIENHHSLRKFLQDAGITFVSETDTEVVAHLLNHLYEGDMLTALQRAMDMLHGSYALGVVCDKEPQKLFCARNDSPLVIGVSPNAYHLASDIPALLSHTRDVVFLEDREIGVLTQNSMTIYNAYGKAHTPERFHVDWDLAAAEKNGYAHYMLKEIHEQPMALRAALAPRSNTNVNWLGLCKQTIRRITIAACGTAYHAGLAGRVFFEQLAHVPTVVAIASEYRTQPLMVGPDELFIAVSQSGETADTLAALRIAKQHGMTTLAICNTVGSTIAREADHTVYTYAGPEIAVASTKAYTTQVEVLLLAAMTVASSNKATDQTELEHIFHALHELPQKAKQVLETERDIQRITSQLAYQKHAFFVGRGLDHALCAEGALKLKEVSYLFCEAYPAGELKHGPIALLKPGSLVIACVTQPHLLQKMMSNLKEVKARGAIVIAVCSEKLLPTVQEAADECISVPTTHTLLAPLLAVIPLQLFAYNMAVARGCDVDKPRNLAKSVTVE